MCAYRLLADKERQVLFQVARLRECYKGEYLFAQGSKVRCTASHDRLPRAQPTACDAYQPGTSFEPFDKFPAAHKKDPTNWATDGTGSDFTP